MVIDDHSTDHTSRLVTRWSDETGIRATVVIPSPKREGWRDCGAVYNCGIRASAGKHVLLTHPEVMVGRQSVQRCVDALEDYEAKRTYVEKKEYSTSGNLAYECTMPGLYACCRIYYLSPREQDALDSTEWYDRGPLSVRDIPRFYEDDVNGHPDFCHRATDEVAQPGSRIPRWESLVFGGCSRETWKRLGGMLETNQWGSVDVGFNHRRQTLGIPNHTCPEESTICLHQNHDDPTKNVVTDRDMPKWVAELRDFPLSDPRKMRYPECDFLGWG